MQSYKARINYHAFLNRATKSEPLSHEKTIETRLVGCVAASEFVRITLSGLSVRMTMKTGMMIALLSVSSGSLANDIFRIRGTVQAVFAEKTRFAVRLEGESQTHPCNGVFYQANRNDETPHFADMYSLFLATYSSKARVEIVVTAPYQGDRAIIHSVGAI